VSLAGAGLSTVLGCGCGRAAPDPVPQVNPVAEFWNPTG